MYVNFYPNLSVKLTTTSKKQHPKHNTFFSIIKIEHFRPNKAATLQNAV